MKTIAKFAVIASIAILAGCSKDEIVPEPVENNSASLKSQTVMDFKGTSEGHVTLISWSPPNPGVHKLFTGKGVITPIGMAKMTLDYTYVSLNLNPAAEYNGIILEGAYGVITAKNGDKIFYKLDVAATHPVLGNYGGTYKFEGWAPCPTIPGLQIPATAEILTTYCTITGGTGKFAGIKGHFKAWGSQWDIPLVYPPNLQFYSVPIPTVLNCEGTIWY